MAKKTEKDELTKAVESHPNVAFTGVHTNGEKKDVPEFVNFPRLKIVIPKGTKHGQGFFSKHAQLLTQLDDFKPFVAKGDK